MVIWDRKTLAPELTIGEVPGTIYGLSGNGWMDMELFDVWFENHFLRYAPSVRPLLLLLDGHSSHYCPGTIKLAAKERVIIFTLPPNTTAPRQGLFWSTEVGMETRMPPVHHQKPWESGDEISVFITFSQGMD